MLLAFRISEPNVEGDTGFRIRLLQENVDADDRDRHVVGPDKEVVFYYETKSAFEDDWVRIKKPFVPEAELQTPDYSPTSYAIVILPEEGDPVVYDTDGTYSMDSLLDTVTTSECEEPTGEQADHIQQASQPSIDLVDAVVAHEPETDAGDRETIRTGLYHVHLPKLAEAGVIDYDTRSETVRYSQQPLLEECLTDIPHGHRDGD
jgi:hypothetical protein